MTKSIFYRILCVFLLSGLLMGFVQPAGVRVVQAQAAQPASDPTKKLETLLVQQLQDQGTADFFVWMVEKADLSPANKLGSKLEKGRFVFDTLRATAERTQKELRASLDRQGVDYKAFYIANKILVSSGTMNLALEIASRVDVEKITANHPFQLQKPILEPVGPAAPTTVEPNISFIKADLVWALGYNGAGIVLAGNDTGLDETHPAIAPHYRGCLNPPTCTSWDHNYNWWDATGTYPNDPWDGFGHGTHTTGTMVGDDGAGNQIGVAPGAQTIHCKNMTDGGGGDDGTFITCFQWDLAPWDLAGLYPDPSKAPDAVNNSWGYWGGGENQFRDEILALQAAGILVEVSAGNEGSSCQSLRSPGDYQEVLTTGSVNHVPPFPGTITGFSSRGPSSLDGDYFPDIMAPGENIRSSVPGGGYEGGWSGTSMAGPHATGLIALMWQACPALRGQVYPTIDLIHQSAAPLTGQGGSNCGGDYTTGPNNDWGFGTIDAEAAVTLAVANCSGLGKLDGTVTDNLTSSPLPDVQIVAQWDGGFSWDDQTDVNGYYTMTVPQGVYTVTANLFGYVPGIATGVVVVTDELTTQDFSLTPATTYTISGHVTDAYTAVPLYAEVTVLGTPLPSVWTDPSTGFYSIVVPEGTYTFQVRADMHQPETREVVVDHDQTQDFGLLPLPCILLVDDDQNDPDVQAYYTDALDAIGKDYNIWDTTLNGDPALADLAGYNMVIWFTGYPYSSVFTSANETAVAAYLDGGGHFLLSSQDYLWEMGLTAFGMDYLHIVSFVSDVSQSTVTGQNVFDGLGPYTLSYPYINYSDRVNPDASALVAFNGDQGNAAVSYDGGSFKTVFTGFPLEAISTVADRAAILGTAIDFFGGCECFPVNIDTLTSNSPVLHGETMYFTSVVTGTAPINYLWDFGGTGTPGGTDPNPTFLYDNYGAFTVTLEAHNACSVDTASIGVQVDPLAPVIDVTPLAFDISVQRTTVVTDLLVIGNLGDLGLDWTLGEAPAVGWLSSDLLSGTVPGGGGTGMFLTFDSTALAVGVYTTTLEVASNDPVNPVVVVPVTLTVDPLPPAIEVTPLSFDLTLEHNAVVTDVLDIKNLGDLGLDWTLAEAPAVGWLSSDLLSGTVPGGESTGVVLTFDTAGLLAGIYTTTLEVASNDPANPLVVVPVTLTVTPQADLALSKTVSAGQVTQGDLLTYTLVVVNNGPDAAVQVSLTDTLPEGVTFVSASEGCSDSGGVVTCALGDLASGASLTVTIVVTADAPGTVVNQAVVSSETPDPVDENNQASAETTVEPESWYVFVPLVAKH